MRKNNKKLSSYERWMIARPIIVELILYICDFVWNKDKENKG